MIWDHLRSFLVLGVSSAFTFSCVWSCPCPSSGRWFLFPLAESISEGIGWCFLVDITIRSQRVLPGGLRREWQSFVEVGYEASSSRTWHFLSKQLPGIKQVFDTTLILEFVIRWLQSNPLKEEGKSPLSAEFVDGTDQVSNKLVDNHLSLLSTCPLHAVVKEDVAEHLKLPRTPMRNKCLTEYWVEQVLQTSPIHSSQGAPRPRWECSRQVSLQKSEIQGVFFNWYPP